MMFRTVFRPALLWAALSIIACDDDSEADDATAFPAPSTLVVGHTLEWKWDEGPFAGVSYRGVFRGDGSVTWLGLTGDDKGNGATEEQYGARHITRDVVVVSWLEEIGYTVTLVLDFKSMRARGIASNETEWYEAGGSFEVIE